MRAQNRERLSTKKAEARVEKDSPEAAAGWESWELSLTSQSVVTLSSRKAALSSSIADTLTSLNVRRGSS